MTTENIQINIREDGSREVVVNINKISGSMDKAAASTDFFMSAMKKLSGVFAAGYLLKQFVEFADTMTLIDSRLKLATKSTQDYMQAQRDMYSISQRNNVGLKETAQLYVRLTDPVKRLGGGIKEVSAIVDAFSSSLRISGVTQQEATAATIQFAQAMSSGKLAGDEFRSLSENAPRFMQALADGLGVPTGALKAMASQGQLTADVVGNSLIKSLGKLQAESQAVANTVGGAMSDLRNDTLVAVGAFDKLTGTSAALADGIQGVSLVVYSLGQIFKEEIAEGGKSATNQMDAMTTVIGVVGSVFEVLTLAVSEASFWIKTAGGAIGAVGAQIAAVAEGDFKRALDIGRMFGEETDERRAQMDKFQAKLSGLTERALAERQKMTVATQYGAQANLTAAQSEQEVINARMRLVGINKKYFEDMATYQKALETGKISQKEYIDLMSELATKTYEASVAGKEARKNLVGSDDRVKIMQDNLVKEQTVFDQEKTIYENRMRMIDTYHKSFDTSEAEFYAQREAARQEYLSAERASYEREKAIIESFKPNNAKEVAENKLRLDKLLRQHLSFIDKLGDARTDDELARLASDRAIVKSSDDMTNAYLSDLQKQIDKVTEANTQRDEGLASVQREHVARLDLAIAYQEQFIAQQLLNGATDTELEQAPKILKFLQDQRKLRSELADALDEKEFLKAQAEWDKAVKATGRKIQDGLYDAIIKGGSSGFKKLRDDVKNWFARLVLNPIIQPIGDFGANIVQQAFGSSAKGAGAMGMGGGGDSSIGGMYNLISTGKSIYNLFSDGFAGISASLGSMVSTLGNLVGSAGVSAFGAGMGMTSSQAAAAAAAYNSAGMASTGSAISAGSSAASAIPIIGWIIAGMSAANGFMKQGFTPNRDLNGIGKVVGAPTNFEYTSMKKLGINSTIANILSGASITTKLFGRAAPRVESQGVRGSIDSSGVSGEAYANIVEKGGLFRHSKRYTNTSALNSEFSNSLSASFNEMKVVTKALGDAIGISTSALDSYRKQFSLAFTNDETKNAELLTNLINEMGNDMARTLIPNMAQFARSGETAQQTLSRLAGVFIATDQVAASLGRNAEQMFGGIGLASEKARTRLVELAGGIDKLQSSVATYNDLFLTDAEKLAPVQAQLNKALTDLGVTGVTTKDQFKALVNSLDLSTESGSKMFVSLMQLAPAFASVVDASEALKQKELERIQAEQEAAARLAEQQAEAARRAEQAAREAAEAAEAARQAELQKIRDHQKQVADILLGDATSVFERLQRSVEAVKSNIQKDYEARDAVLASQIDAAQQNLNALQNVSRAVQSTLDGMKLDESADMYRELSQQVIKDAIATIKAGGSVDQEALQKALGVVSKTSEEMFSSSTDFRRDFYQTANDLYDLSQSTDGRIDVAQASLNTLNEQRDILKQTYDAQIAALDKQFQLAQDQMNLIKGIDTGISDLSSVFRSFAEYVGAIKADPLAGSKVGINDAYMRYIGRRAGSGEMDFWQSQIDQGMSLTDVVSNIKNSDPAAGWRNYLMSQGINPDTYTPPSIPGVNSDFSWLNQNPTLTNSPTSPTGYQPIVVNNDALIELLEDVKEELVKLNETTDHQDRNLENLTGMIDRVTAGGNAMLVQDVESL